MEEVESEERNKTANEKRGRHHTARLKEGSRVAQIVPERRKEQQAAEARKRQADKTSRDKASAVSRLMDSVMGVLSRLSSAAIVVKRSITPPAWNTTLDSVTTMGQ